MKATKHTMNPIIRSIADNSEGWRKALIAADRVAALVLVKHGVLPEDDSDDPLKDAIQDVATEGFDYEALDKKYSDLVLPIWESIENSNDIERAQIDAEEAIWMGAYALGLAMGVRLAGGGR